MKKIDNTWFGLLAGLIAPFAVLLIIFKLGGFMEADEDVQLLWLNIKMTTVLFRPCLLINLAIFMITINRNWLKFSRGLVFATMIYAAVVIYYHFQ
ncbi:MAG: hypothetical protein GC181_02095 [Bacteroidetes bacterium]|nr:hypothetical protein [Bacteroidota bacterium]